MSVATDHNLARLAESSFERRGDYASLLFEDRWHRSGELFDRAQRIAGGLAELGVVPGDRVVVSMANCPEVGIVYNAIWRAGAVVTPATFLLPPAELRHVVTNAEASAVVTTPEFVDKVAAAIDGLETVRHVVSTDGAEGSVVSLRTLEEADPAPIVPRRDEDLAALLYTGGTTGRSKGVMLSHANLYFSGHSAHDAGHVDGVNRALATLPLSHSYGILVTLAGMHSEERGVAVLLRWFDPAAWPALIAEHSLQISAVVPSMLQLLLGQPLEDHDLSSLRYVSCGGAPLAPEVEAEFRRRVPNVSIRQGYGLTETAALIATNPVDRGKPGSVGIPVPGCQVEVRDEDGRVLGPGEPGEICARSPGVMQGYWRSPDVTAEALRDGWLYTGDIGYVDDEGYLFIVDRKKDLIIRGGFNVYPREVEEVLYAHPAIAEAAVIGVEHPTHGEEVKAVVVLRAGLSATPEEIVGYCRAHLAAYKYPRVVEFREELPKTATGKILKRELREG
jgi:long-chain acyl-CoA synthetase